MADLIHNYYAVEGIQAKDLVSELNTRSKEEKWYLRFQTASYFERKGLSFVCTDAEDWDSLPAKYLSEKYPDKTVMHYAQDEFSDDETWFEWHEGKITAFDPPEMSVTM